VSDEKVLAARWSPENHLASKQWMLAKEEDSGRSVLVVDCDDERVLPVFGGEGEAEIFVWLEGTFEDGWKVRETSAGELVSMLHGPFARVTRVALDRAPEMVGMYAVSLASVTRERFLSCRRGGGDVRCAKPRLASRHLSKNSNRLWFLRLLPYALSRTCATRRTKEVSNQEGWPRLCWCRWTA